MREDAFISKAALKDLAALKVKKFRRRAGRFLVEGAVMVGEALDAGRSVETLIVNEDRRACDEIAALLARAEANSVCTLFARSIDMKRLSDTIGPAAAIGVLPMRPCGLEDMAREGALRLAVLDGVQDPGNAGAIIRSADAFGLDGVIVTRGGVEWTNPKVLRSSAASCFHLPIAADVTEEELATWLAAQCVRSLAAVARGGEDAATVEPGERWAAVFGNEIAGPSEALLRACEMRVTIATPGRAESLNVAVSAGVLLYMLTAPRR